MEKPFVVHRPGALGDILCALSLYQDLKDVYGEVVYAVGSAAFHTLSPLAELLGVPLLLDAIQDKQKGHWHPLIGYPFNADGTPAPTTKHLTRYFADEMGVECHPTLYLLPPNVVTDRPYVTLQTTAGWSPLKNWALENWTALAKLLKDAGYGVVQIGGPADALIPDVDLQFCGSPFLANLYAQAGASGHIGPDSVFNHTAGLIRWGSEERRIPAVILFGSTSPAEAGYPTAVNIFRGLPCQPCFGHVCNEPDTHACLRSVSPVEVLGAALRQFGKPVPPVTHPTQKVSVTMICKNEESCIATALESAKGADEIIVCDTGSTDSTLQIIESLGWSNIRVVHYPWNDHFADARNAALDAATGDWCVVLDCDETLDPETLPALRKIIQTTSARTLQFDTISAGNESTRHWMIRAHKRIPSIRWVGRVHEALNCDDGARAEECRLRYGWSAAHHLDPQRVKRLLLKDVLDAGLRDERPGTRTLYYLAREFWYTKTYPLALFWFHERVKEIGYRPECADAWLYIARINWATGKPEEAREAALKSLVLAPDCRETLLFLAEMSFPEQAAVWNRFAAAATNEGVLFKRA